MLKKIELFLRALIAALSKDQRKHDTMLIAWGVAHLSYRGLSQREIAYFLGCHQKTVWRYMHKYNITKRV